MQLRERLRKPSSWSRREQYGEQDEPSRSRLPPSAVGAGWVGEERLTVPIARLEHVERHASAGMVGPGRSMGVRRETDRRMFAAVCCSGSTPSRAQITRFCADSSNRFPPESKDSPDRGYGFWRAVSGSGAAAAASGVMTLVCQLSLIVAGLWPRPHVIPVMRARSRLRPGVVPGQRGLPWPAGEWG